MTEERVEQLALTLASQVAAKDLMDERRFLAALVQAESQHKYVCTLTSFNLLCFFLIALLSRPGRHTATSQ